MTLAWRLEWAVAVRRRRLLMLNVLVPLALVALLLVGGAPPAHAAAVLTVLFVLFGVFGSAIPLVRDGERGLLRRLARAGLGERRLLGGRLLAQATLDVVELVPSALLLLVAGPASPSGVWLGLPLALGLTLLVANAVGAWAAAAAGSMAEAALASSVVALLSLHGAGVFRTPEPGGVGALVEALSPFRLLHQEVLSAAGGSAAPGGGSAVAVSVAAAFLLTTLAAAPPLVRALDGVRD